MIVGSIDAWHDSCCKYKQPLGTRNKTFPCSVERPLSHFQSGHHWLPVYYWALEHYNCLPRDPIVMTKHNISHFQIIFLYLSAFPDSFLNSDLRDGIFCQCVFCVIITVSHFTIQFLWEASLDSSGLNLMPHAMLELCQPHQSPALLCTPCSLRLGRGLSSQLYKTKLHHMS